MVQTILDYVGQPMTLRDVFFWFSLAYICFFLSDILTSATVTGESFLLPFIWLGLLACLFIAAYFAGGDKKQHYLIAYVPLLLLLSYITADWSKPKKHKQTPRQKPRTIEKDPLAVLEQLLAEAKAKAKITEPRQAKTIDIESLKQRLEKIKGDDSE